MSRERGRLGVAAGISGIGLIVAAYVRSVTEAAQRRSGPAAVLQRYRPAVNGRPWRSLILGGAVTVAWAVIVGLILGTHPHATAAQVAEAV